MKIKTDQSTKINWIKYDQTCKWMFYLAPASSQFVFKGILCLKKNNKNSVKKFLELFFGSPGP